jgi:hypothetical protein
MSALRVNSYPVLPAKYLVKSFNCRLRTAQTQPEPAKEITKIRVYSAAMKKGRTSKPDKLEIQKAICNMIAASNKSVRSILKELSKSMDGVPDLSTVMEWLNDKEFAEQYARAKEEQYAVLAEEILEIADDESLDVAFDDKGKPFVDKEHITRSKLRVDARKLILSELKSKISPDKISAGHGAEAGLTINIIDRFGEPRPKK